MGEHSCTPTKTPEDAFVFPCHIRGAARARPTSPSTSPRRCSSPALAAARRFERGDTPAVGWLLGIGENKIEVAPTHGGTAQATRPDGKTHTVKLHGGELAFSHSLAGVDYRLVQIEPGIK